MQINLVKKELEDYKSETNNIKLNSGYAINNRNYFSQKKNNNQSTNSSENLNFNGRWRK